MTDTTNMTATEKFEAARAAREAAAQIPTPGTFGITPRRATVLGDVYDITSPELAAPIGTAKTMGDARLFAIAGEMFALMEEMDAGLWFGPDSPQASRVHDLVRRAHGA